MTVLLACEAADEGGEAVRVPLEDVDAHRVQVGAAAVALDADVEGLLA